MRDDAHITERYPDCILKTVREIKNVTNVATEKIPTVSIADSAIIFPLSPIVRVTIVVSIAQNDTNIAR